MTADRQWKQCAVWIWRWKLAILEGLLDATSGQVEILGHQWGRDDAAIRQLIGISLQETQLSEKLTVRETVGLCRQASSLPLPEAVRRRARASVRHLLDRESDANRSPSE